MTLGISVRVVDPSPEIHSEHVHSFLYLVHSHRGEGEEEELEREEGGETAVRIEYMRE